MEPHGFSENNVHQFLLIVGQIEFVFQHLDGAMNGGERVADFVRDSGCHGSDERPFVPECEVAVPSFEFQ